MNLVEFKPPCYQVWACVTQDSLHVRGGKHAAQRQIHLLPGQGSKIAQSNHPLEMPLVFYPLPKDPKGTSFERKNFQLPTARQDEHLRQGG